MFDVHAIDIHIHDQHATLCGYGETMLHCTRLHSEMLVMILGNP
jgi:hypothetical protein